MTETIKKPRKKREPGAPAQHRRRSYRIPLVPDNTPNQNRVCVLTGASGLLGDEFIKRYSIDYKIIAIHNRNEIKPPIKMVDPLYSSFDWENPPVEAIRCDLSVPGNVDELAKGIIDKYKKVDLLINAACYRNIAHLLDDGALDHAAYAYSINVLVPLYLSVALMKHFWIANWEENVAHNRNIVNISSTAGSYIYPDQGQTLYSSSKAALNFASHHMASEFWERGIRVNSLAPNTFPGIVPTQRVLDQIIAFDKGRDTGQFVLIDKE